MESNLYLSKNLRYVKINDLIGNKDFYSLFDDKLKNYLENEINDITEYHKALKFLLFRNVNNFDDFKLKYFQHGDFKIWNKTSFIYKNNEIRNKMKGTSFRGKKRPEHSEKMKKLMLGIDRGDSFRELKKTQLQSIDFKRKFLTNKNISFFDDNDILKKYSEYISNVRKGPKHKKKKILKFLNDKKYYFDVFKNFYDTPKDLSSDDKIHEVYSNMLSIISTYNIQKNEKMGTTKYFKRGFLEVNYCLNKTLIHYRSSWEEITIKFLEEKKIYYLYEHIYLPKSDGKLYLPDFQFEYNNQSYLLEIKGYIRGKEGKNSEILKIESALKYCRENSLKYVYLQKPLTDLKQLENGIKN